MKRETNVVLAGVGGQGVLLISEILALAAIEAGNDAKQTEEHGVSQRGGSVCCHVRFAPRVWSPLVRPGEADAVVGLEKLEGLRYAHYLREGGVLVVSTHEILPISLGAAADTYPHHAVEFLRGEGVRVMDIAATESAYVLGDARAANMILMGALSTCLDLPSDVWDRMLIRRLPERSVQLNQRAFAEGVRLARSSAWGSR